MKQSTNHIMMMEPVGFHSNPETMETNTYQAPDPSNIHSIQSKAVWEFRALRDLLVGKGVIITTAIGQASSPDDIFCNNWVATFGNKTLGYYPMLAPNRQRERRDDIKRVLESIYDVAFDFSELEKEGKFLESTGAHWLDRENRIAYFSLSPRCNEELALEFCKRMDFEPVLFHTKNHVGKPVYHTDVMMYIGSGYAGICSGCILEEDRKRVLDKLEKNREIVDLSMDQLKAFCGNALELLGSGDKKILVMSGGAHKAMRDEQKLALKRYISEIVYVDIPTIETYGGGSARCMLLELH